MAIQRYQAVMAENGRGEVGVKGLDPYKEPQARHFAGEFTDSQHIRKAPRPPGRTTSLPLGTDRRVPLLDLVKKMETAEGVISPRPSSG